MRLAFWILGIVIFYRLVVEGLSFDNLKGVLISSIHLVFVWICFDWIVFKKIKLHGAESSSGKNK